MTRPTKAILWAATGATISALVTGGGIAHANPTSADGSGSSTPAKTMRAHQAPIWAEVTFRRLLANRVDGEAMTVSGQYGTPTGTVTFQLTRCSRRKQIFKYVTVPLTSGKAEINTPSGWELMYGGNYSGDHVYRPYPKGFVALAIDCRDVK